VRQGRVDLLVAWLANCQEELDREKLGQAVLDVGWGILKRARPDNPTWDQSGKRDFPPSDFNAYTKQRPPFLPDINTLVPVHPFPFAQFRMVCQRGDLVTDNAKDLPSITKSLIVCDGALQFKQHIVANIILANGDVSGPKFFTFHHCVIVTDASLHAFSCSNAVVIARGNVRIEAIGSGNLRSHIYTGGRIEINSFSHKGQQVPFDALTAQIEDGEGKEGVRRPLNLVRFFELSDVGVEVTETQDSVIIQSLKPGSPLEKAGLRKGDAIVAVDGDKTQTADAVRRQLRRAFVSQESTFTIDRHGKQMELPVSFYGWELPKD